MKSTAGRWALVATNLLLPVAILTFASGFFPYKPFIAGRNEFSAVDISLRPAPIFDKIVFMVIDALRRSVWHAIEKIWALTAPVILYTRLLLGLPSFKSERRDQWRIPCEIDFSFSLIRHGNAIPFTAHASSPTITMPKVKAITTGSVPSFLDVILNFAESDTTSTLAHMDTWLNQLRHLPDGKIIMYGDDTWLKLFPNFFARHDGTSSFFVSVGHNSSSVLP